MLLPLFYTKQDVKLVKEYLSAEIIQNFLSPHKLDLSLHSNGNENCDNEKGDVIGG